MSASSLTPFVSICIPAYKRPANLQRLLSSILAQTYHDYEIIITDDSPDDSVKEVCLKFADTRVRYHKNSPALGTPANWNEGISQAKGQWIKLMHDDDWFRDENSLNKFAHAAENGVPFISSRYVNVFTDGHEEMPSFPLAWHRRLRSKPMTLLAKNVIGPPSVTLINKAIVENYDPRLKWRVDIEYYIRLLEKKIDHYLIDENLINVGVSSSQVTNDCLNVAEVELPEGLSLLRKFGVGSLQNILVYDAYWRIIRNTNTRSIGILRNYTPGQEWPRAIEKMTNFQSFFSGSVLKIGLISKILMFLSFLSFRYFSKPE